MNIRNYAQDLLSTYNLNRSGWIFKFNNQSRTIGLCNHTRKTVEFSQNYIHIPEFEIIDVLKHEVAHALAGIGNGHNLTWKQIAIKIGAKPEACKSVGESTKTPKYHLICNKCWYKVPMFRKPEIPRSCGKCGPGRYNPDFKMTLVENLLNQPKMTTQSFADAF